MHRSAAIPLALAVALAACSSNPKPQEPAPAAAVTQGGAAPAAPTAQPAAPVSLAGEWEVEIATAQQGVVVSMMRLVERGGGYIGVLQPLLNAQGESAIPGAGPSPFQVRSATVEGSRATIVMDFEGDEARIIANFRGANRLDGSLSSRALAGRVTMRRR